jgi:hypothetical protein
MRVVVSSPRNADDWCLRTKPPTQSMQRQILKKPQPDQDLSRSSVHTLRSILFITGIKHRMLHMRCRIALERALLNIRAKQITQITPGQHKVCGIELSKDATSANHVDNIDMVQAGALVVTFAQRLWIDSMPTHAATVWAALHALCSRMR